MSVQTLQTYCIDPTTNKEDAQMNRKVYLFKSYQYKTDRIRDKELG